MFYFRTLKRVVPVLILRTNAPLISEVTLFLEITGLPKRQL